MIHLPAEYAERMKVLLGDGFNDYLNELEKPPVRAFRVNTAKIGVDDFEKINIFGSQKIPYTENGFYLDYDKVGTHPYHHAGMIYVQEPAAMMPAECIDVMPDWKILDMCAAPGGKSTQLKNKLGDGGVLVSNEIISSRCKILTGNIERLGLSNTVTTCMDTKKLVRTFPETFDLIMVDAPCSGEGMFRKEKAALTEWSTENVKMCAERQAEILENATLALKSGGYIIYATCTFSLEENEMVIDTFLNRHPEFELVPVKPQVLKATSDGIFFDGCRTQNISYARRFYPHKNAGEGQFAAVLHNKNGDCSVDFTQKRKQTEKNDKVLFDFLDDVLTDYDKNRVLIYNGSPVYFTPDFEIKKGTAFSCGVTIGEIRKNYIQPHHQFFSAMGKYFKRKIDLPLDGDDIKKYLHGEEITADCPNGWAVVTVNNCPIGGVKAVNGRLKNHYPKGLRNK